MNFDLIQNEMICVHLPFEIFKLVEYFVSFFFGFSVQSKHREVFDESKLIKIFRSKNFKIQKNKKELQF